jgi:hypothetical protein
MRLPLDRLRIESVLEQVAHPAVNAIEPGGEVAEKIVHAGRQIRDRRLDHQVQMIRHQHPRMEDPLTLEHDLRELLDELPPIPIAAHDVPPLVAAARDVMDAPRRVVT